LLKIDFAETQMLAELRSLESLSSVLSTFRNGTPLKAARLLSRAPSTVYRAIERLENEIGAPLFDRNPAGWTPTAIGSRIIQLAEKIESEAAQTELQVLGTNAGFPAPLRISASDGFAEGYLVPIVARYARSKATPAIELIVDNHFANLTRREADIAIRPSNKPGDGLIGRRAGKLSHAFYGATPLFRKNGLPESVSDLSRFKVCILSGRFEHHTAATWWRHDIRRRMNVSFVANTEMSLAAAIGAGMGIGILPCFLGDRLKGVQRVRTIAVGQPVDIWLVTHAALKHNKVVSGLIGFLAGAIRRDAAKLAGTSR
jgi:DNA-binding transcriptional LysR family regulator